MTDLSPARIAALGTQLHIIEQDIVKLRTHLARLTQQLAPVVDHCELVARVDDLAACLLDDTDPPVTPGVQARLVQHTQEANG